MISGDVLSEVIVGANIRNTSTGSSYLVFGGPKFAAALVKLGISSADTQAGNTASETYTGAAGNDVMTGDGEADVVLGGVANDVFILNASSVTALINVFGAGDNLIQLAGIDGGAGMDTIRLSGTDMDLTQVTATGASTADGFSRIESIEILNWQLIAMPIQSKLPYRMSLIWQA